MSGGVGPWTVGSRHVLPRLPTDTFNQYVDKCWLLRAVPEIILGGGGDGPQILFCPVGGGCFVDNVLEGWGVGR